MSSNSCRLFYLPLAEPVLWLTMPVDGDLAVSDGPVCEPRRDGYVLQVPAGEADGAFPIPEPAIGAAAGFLLTNFSPMTSN